MRKFLLFLRLLLVALLFLSLLDYAIVRRVKRQEPVRVFVVVDASLSMSLAGRMRSAELAAQRLVSEKSGKIRYSLYEFSETLRPFKEFANLSPKGWQSAYRETLSKIMDESWKRRPDAVFFISDGADTQNVSYEDLLQSFRESLIPFYTVYAGTADSFSDVEILDVQSPSVVKVGEKAKIQAFFSQRGFTGSSAEVLLSIRGFSQQKKSIMLRSYEAAAVQFELRVSKPGVYVGKVSALPLVGEKGTQNNEKYFSFAVLKDKWNVLFVHGTLNWEYSFLKKFLISHPELKVKSVWLQNTAAGSSIAREISQSDFTLFGDIDCAALSKWVSRAPSYLVLVSDNMMSHCAKNTGFLPFTFIQSAERKNSQDIYKVPVGDAALFSNRGDAAQKLPRTLLLTELVPVRLKTGTKRILEAASLKGEKFPLFAVKDAGLKKTGYVFSPSTWRWAFTKDKPPQAAYLAMWDGVMRFFMKKQKTEFEIYPERKTFSLNETGKFFAAFSGSVDEASALQAKIITPSGKHIQAVFTPENAERTLFTAEQKLDEEGKYVLVGDVKNGGKHSGAKKETFTVKRLPEDYAASMGNPEALKRIAQATGGKAFNASQLDQIKNAMSSMKNTREEKKVIKITRSPLFFILLLFLFSLDIFIRKRAGLP